MRLLLHLVLLAASNAWSCECFAAVVACSLLPPTPVLTPASPPRRVPALLQVMQAEADDKAGKAIARYIHMAFSDSTGEPTRDSNPLLRRNHKLSATNPLL